MVAGGSEQIADYAGIAGTQPLQSAQGFLGCAVRCGMVKEAVERFGKGEAGIVPLAAEQTFWQALATEFAGAQADENSDLAIVADDDGRVVAGICDDHGAIVSVRTTKTPWG